MHRRAAKQGGWVGLVVILVALLIVAWLAKDALKEYGLMSGMERVPKAESARGPGAGATGATPDTTSVTPAPLNALEKARGLQGDIREQAAEQAKRIDEGTK